jgi:hypothetical protein
MTSTKRFLCINKSIYFNITISQTVCFFIWNEDIPRDTNFLYWRNSLFLGALFLCLWSREGGKDSIAFVRAMNVSAVVTLGGVQVPMLEGRIWPAVILVDMRVVVALLSKSETELESAKNILNKIDFFFQTNCRCST